MTGGKRACVIGAGFGGLALAIRLQAAGVATTLIEARDKPGGRAGYWQRDGFTFDAGPTAIADPAALRELWQMTGHDMAADVELMPIVPLCRFSWPDGASFDYSNDAAALRKEIARLDPADIAGYDAFLAHSDAVCRELGGEAGAAPNLDWKSMVKAAPALAKHRAWCPVYDTVSRFVRHEKLRQALSYPALLAGGNPMTASAIVHGAMHRREHRDGLWWPRGGVNRLVAGMLRHFERIGGQTRMHDPAIRIDTAGARATEVQTLSGWREKFAAVASNGDMVHTYRDLLKDPRGAQMARRLAKKRFAPSLFTVHFGIEGSWPGIPHRMVLFGPRFKDLFEDIEVRGVLPADFPVYLHHPTVTDPSVAPAGKSTFGAMVPVAHMGKLAVDWEQVGPLLEQRILAEVERRLIPDLPDRIVIRFHYGPRDYALDLNAHLGSALGFDPVPTQIAWSRVRNRDDAIGNLYLVGAGLNPGGGVPGVLAGAKETAGLMLEDLAR